ncbi:hypothetical protein [Dapis sp. BLCC M172]|uniref:hypothetical protein n=1 Tax=Dapis sp. BLCC M172 TaxID=2975281 RepID=UPI003CFB85F4
MFTIQNAIVKRIQRKNKKWVGGVVFPENMPEIFRHRRGGSSAQLEYMDLQVQVNQQIDNLKFYPGTYIYAGPFHQHFGHALTESIHRLWPFKSNISDRIVFAVSLEFNAKLINYTPPQWFIQILEILEIPIDKCIWVRKDCIFEELIIPEPGSELALGPKNWYRSYLEKLQQRIFDATHHLRKELGELKLFLGRDHISLGEYTAGEKYLKNLLVNEGYISFQPENYHVLEQIAYLIGAKKIIFSEGSAIYSLELINYLDADIACIPRRAKNRLYYPHIYSKCRNYIVAGNGYDLLTLGIGRRDNIKKIPINKNPYQLIESLRNYNFASLKDWDEEEFLAQERCDIMTYIYQVHTRFKKIETVHYLELLERYLQLRINRNKIANYENHNSNPIIMKSSRDRLNQLAIINQSSNYLEIGVCQGATFNAINIKNKVAVDPKFKFNINKYANNNIVFLEVNRENFFRNYAKRFEPFQLIYLDDVHTFELTFRDFCASLSFANTNTIWLINNTCPGSYAQAQPSYQNCARLKNFSQEKGGAWMGDVFKVVAAIHDFFPQFSFATFPDHGQTVVWNKWRKDFQPKWNSLETISRLEYLDFVEVQETLFKREPYDQIFEGIKSSLT